MAPPRSRVSLVGSAASIYLDALRGMAALVVFYGHSWLGLAGPPSGGGSPWYLYLAGFGRQAVMVFFALSGFLVGGGALRRIRNGKFAWPDYVLQRMTRLYVVLIPALLLGLFWDRLGAAIAGVGGIYGGHFPSFVNWNIPQRLGWRIGIGNLFFLESRWFRTFGSNSVLWSLVCEFWYYLLFPCLVLAVRERQLSRRVLYLAASAVAIYLGGRDVLYDFPAWLAGVAVYLAPKPGRRRSWLVPAGIGGLIGASCLSSSVSSALNVYLADYLAAFGAAACLYAFVHHPPPAPRRIFAAAAGHFASISYTLYLVHLPLLVFLEAVWIGPHPWPRDGHHIMLWGVTVIAVFAYAELIWFCFESRTDAVRRWLWPRCIRDKAVAAQA